MRVTSKFTSRIFLYTLVLSTNNVLSLLLTRPSEGHDIFNGRHFNELIADNGTASHSAVLVMYKPSCDSKLQEYKLSDNLPSDYYVAFLKYDYETTPKYSWYHFGDDEDLYKRYNPKTCLELLYFPVGTPLKKPIRTELSSGKKISEAVWGLVKVKFHIRNLYGSNIHVRLEVKKKVVSSVTLKPMFEEEATAFVTHNMYVHDAITNELIYARVIDLNLDGTELVIDKFDAADFSDMTEDQWKETAKTDLELKTNKIFQRMYKVSHKYLLDFKQPAVVPTVTEVGYEVQKVPTFLTKELLKYYNSEKSDEKTNKNRLNKPKTVEIAMDDEISQKIDLILRIMIEEWAETQVKFSRTSPIIEHKNGSVVYGHVGNVKEEVIGLLVVLKKDLGEQQDWPFEIIGHDGVRRNLTLDAGEFIIYEAATCLLSNPYPFHGSNFVTLSIFYRPDDGWKWQYSADKKNILYGNEIKENVNIFATNTLLERSKLKTPADEL